MKITHLIFATFGFLFQMQADADSRLEPITDPTEIAALGIPANSEPVWRLVGPISGQARDLLAPEGGPSGINLSSTVSAEDFQPFRSTYAYSEMPLSQLTCPTGTGSGIFYAPIELPDDRELLYLDIWASDIDASDDIRAYLIQSCTTSDNPQTPINTVLGQIQYATSGGNYFQYVQIPDNTFTNTKRCAYTIVINLDVAANTCSGSDLIFYKARVEWRYY